MAVTIGSNISSLRTIRQLDGTTRNLASTSERLASGQRINRASDDAAGLAIVSSLDATSRIFTKALANVNDGISLLSITDGAMRELGSVLTRVKELATQSANGSYSATQRRALDEEGQKLRDEYNRILATTSFNGVKTLNGAQATIGIQAGADGTGSLLQLSAPNVGDYLAPSASSLSLDGIDDYVEASEVWDGNGDFTASVWLKTSDTGSNSNVIGQWENAAGTDNVNGFWQIAHTNGTLTAFVRDTTIVPLGGHVLSVNGGYNNDQWHFVAIQRSGTDLTIDIDGGTTRQTMSGISAGDLSSAGTAFRIGNKGAAAEIQALIDDARVYNRALSAAEIATLYSGGEPSSSGLLARYRFEEGAGITAIDDSGNGRNATLIDGATWSGITPSRLVGHGAVLESFSLLTAGDARSAMNTIESAFARLSSAVGDLGSQMSRLQTVINTISASRENYQAAAGRIKDADVAQESAHLVRHGILQQTASSVLAQANQQPQIAIQLLGAI